MLNALIVEWGIQWVWYEEFIEDGMIEGGIRKESSLLRRKRKQMYKKSFIKISHV